MSSIMGQQNQRAEDQEGCPMKNEVLAHKCEGDKIASNLIADQSLPKPSFKQQLKKPGFIMEKRRSISQQNQYARSQDRLKLSKLSNSKKQLQMSRISTKRSLKLLSSRLEEVEAHPKGQKPVGDEAANSNSQKTRTKKNEGKIINTNQAMQADLSYLMKKKYRLEDLYSRKGRLRNNLQRLNQELTAMKNLQAKMEQDYQIKVEQIITGQLKTRPGAKRRLKEVYNAAPFKKSILREGSKSIKRVKRKDSESDPAAYSDGIMMT